MGDRGPVPKRKSQLRRENKPEVEVVSAPAGVGRVPDPDPDWHPIASMVWESLEESGQSVWFESSDWASAYVLCESISREMKPQPVVSKDGDVSFVSFPPKAAAQTAWRGSMAALLMAEGDRRRASVELERPAPEGNGDVEHLDDVRLRLAGSG